MPRWLSASCDRSFRRLAGFGEDLVEHRLEHRIGQVGVAVVDGGGEQCLDGAYAGGLEEVRGAPLADAQPSGGGDSSGLRVPVEPRPIRGRGRGRSATGTGSGWPGRTRSGCPSRFAGRPGVHVIGPGCFDCQGLGRDEGVHDVLGDGLEQAVLVPEQPVDRRGLHAGGLGDPAGGDGRQAVLAE